MNLDFSTANIIVLIVALIISVTIHEAMHAFTSHWLGDDTAHAQGRVSLNPLRHIDPYMTLLLPVVSIVLFKVPILAAKPVPFNPNRVRFGEWGAALVGLAGPLTNLVLAVLGAGILYLLGVSLSLGLAQALLVFVQVNVLLFVFNMLPIPPLDGSRLIYALAPESLQEVMASLERYGIMIVFALVLFVPAFGAMLSNLDGAVLRLLIR